MRKFAKLLSVIVLFTSSIGCGGKPEEPKKEATAGVVPTGVVEEKANITRPEITLQIRHPWNRGNAVLVRLDIDQLRAYGLSKKDVMKALEPSRLIDPNEPPWPPPPPGVRVRPSTSAGRIGTKMSF